MFLIEWSVVSVVIALVPEQTGRVQVPECEIRGAFCSRLDNRDDIDPQRRTGFDVEFRCGQRPSLEHHAMGFDPGPPGRAGQRTFDVNQRFLVRRQGVKTGIGTRLNFMGCESSSCISALGRARHTGSAQTTSGVTVMAENAWNNIVADRIRIMIGLYTQRRMWPS
ncbi:MAG: hypothetical protein RIA64_00665 [Rhodospirillales bacterium]